MTNFEVETGLHGFGVAESSQVAMAAASDLRLTQRLGL